MIRTKLPPQLHIGSATPPAPDSRPYGASGAYKPVGALWTSTYETAWTDGWPYWLASEDYEYSWTTYGESACGWLLEPVECRVFQIDSAADARRFLDRYGITDSSSPIYDRHFRGGYTGLIVDWAAVAADLDAVRLTCPYDPEVRHDMRPFYGWDCESTAWLSWQFSAVNEVELPPLNLLSYR